ncbi:MAG: DNA polymerase III subunit beta [Microbacterium sp.]
MRFHVNRDVFSEAVSFVVKLLPQRNPQPILAGVLIEAGDDGLSLAAFDYEASARTVIEATVDEPGTILVHGRLLSEIASRLPNAPIEIAVLDDGAVSLTCGSARFSLASMPVQEYPAIPEVSGESGLVPAEDFATAIAQVAFAASRDDVTPVLTGVQLEVSGTQLSLVATDRYRVALRDIPWDGGAGDPGTNALVPARTLQEVGKTFAHGGDISIAFSGAGDREIIAFTAGNKTVTSLLIKGNFPPVRRLFPDQTEHHAVVNTAELQEAVRRVSLVLDRAAPLRFTFAADSVTMDASGSEQARASETVDAHLTGGDDVTLGLNPQYLLEALGAVRSEFARITFTSSENANKLSPVLITSQTSVDKAGTDTFKYLLQPNLLLR